MSTSGVLCFTPPHVYYDRRKCSRLQFHLAASVASQNDVSESISRRYLLRRCDCFDLHKKLVPYHEAWLWQKSIVETRKALIERDEDDTDLVITLQHPPVYTLGTRSSEEYLKFSLENPPYDVHRTDRGGEVTYHGPGQLVMYPIINLRHHKMDLHWYLRSLEEVIIGVLASFSIKASRLDGFTGVWVGNKKVAAIGVHVSKWLTYHGVALNVTTDLGAFKQIVPCGISNRDVGSLLEMLGSSKTDPHELMDITHESLLAEFANVFELNLETSATNTFDLFCRGV